MKIKKKPKRYWNKPSRKDYHPSPEEILATIEQLGLKERIFPSCCALDAPWDYLCADCGKNGWSPMLIKELWNQITPDKPRFLCFNCMETRVGRKLTASDLLQCPMNHYHPNHCNNL